MKQYLNILDKVLKEWIENKDRTWVWTISVFWTQTRYDLRDWFPLITTKKMFFKWIVVELIWFLRWDTNIKYLVDRGVHIWDEWAYQFYLKDNWLEDKYPKYTEEWYDFKKEFINKIKELDKNDPFVIKYGELWPVYWKQWRDWENPKGENIDQIKKVIEQIKYEPKSRRMIVSAWNPAEIEEMAISWLPPCHTLFQFYVNQEDNTLNLQLYQRSADMFLGVPFNIASYSLLLMLISKITWYKPWEFVHTTGDTHIYLNHLEQVKQQLGNKPLDLPTIEFKKDIKTLKDIENLEFDDIELINYKSAERITAPIAV